MTPVKTAAVFLCGPRAGGNADTAGLAFAEGLRQAGLSPRIIPLREYAVAPCRGCGACAVAAEHRCPLSEADDVESLFVTLRQADNLAFASPIYFYHVPALFKAFIDRAQRHYEIRLGEEPQGPQLPDRPARILLVAGRRQGERLFEGTLLTLKYFLWPFHRRPSGPCLLRGMDAPGDLAADGPALAQVAAYAGASLHGD